MGLFSRFFGKNKKGGGEALAGAASSLDHERLTHLFERAPSFSLVAIPGDASDEVAGLLRDCGYTLKRGGGFRGPFDPLYSGLNQHDGGADNSIVMKAWYRAAGYTILLDPEMVLITETTRLAKIAERSGASVIVAIWERGSETAALAEIGPGGIARQSWFCQGKVSDTQVNPHREVIERPNSDGLKAALETYGLRQESVFGEVEATVLELQE